MGGTRSKGAILLWPAVAVLTILGFALRIAAGRGGLWTDEAWSVVYAHQAVDPLGVFTRINHDNNHHLNTLWLQAVGMHAPPLLMRAPAILAGTLTIPMAALLFSRRTTVGAVAAAALFALSPIMVIYGSEARGYAMMLLAVLCAIWLVTNAAEGRGTHATPWLIALTAAFGLLSHLTMLAPLVLLTLWVFLEKRSSVGTPAAIVDTLKLMGAAAAVSAAVLLLVLLPPVLSRTGLQTGGYNPFTYQNYAIGLSNMEVWAVGWTLPARVLAIAILFAIGIALLVQRSFMPRPRALLYAILILGVPVVIIVERIGNAQFARFYLCSVIGLLLLGADWTAQAAQGGRVSRALCALVAAIFVFTAAWHDLQFIEVGRGQPERAIGLMAADNPRGASIDVQTDMYAATFTVAANQANFPLTIAKGCAPAEFLVVARDESVPQTVMRCGHPMRMIAWSAATPLTGDAWILYRASPLQTSGPPVSGPPPRRALQPPLRRAGVAQG